MRLLLFVTVFGFILTGCAAPLLKPVDLVGTAKTVSFVQNGRLPVKYTIGAVDGKTSWSNYSIMGARLNEEDKRDPTGGGTITATGAANTDIAIGAGLEIVSGIGKAMADAAMKDDPKFYQRLFSQMVGARELGADTGRAVLPAMARTLGVGYSAAQLTIIPTAGKIEGEGGRYVATDPGTDMVVVFTLREVILSEKPSVRGLKAVVTFGMYDKEVMPYFLGDLAIFRRDPAGLLSRVWSGRCGNSFVNAPYEEWTALRDSPALGGDLLDKSVPRVGADCEASMRNGFSSAGAKAL